MFLFVAALILLLIAVLLHRILTPPSNFPRNIPTIPVWVSLLGFFTPLDQLEIYSQHLEPYLRQHGAAKFFFGGRWNILVQRPDLLSDVLKHEDVFAKSGNQKKIPYSVLAAFTGDNVISAHGETWKLYREVMKPGLQRHDFDINEVRKNAERLTGLVLEAQKGLGEHRGVAVNPLIQRFAMQTLGQTVLGTDFKVSLAARPSVLECALTLDADTGVSSLEDPHNPHAAQDADLQAALSHHAILGPVSYCITAKGQGACR